MPTMQLTVRSFPREGLVDDAAVANRLVQLLHDGLAQGAGRPVAVVVRATSLDLVRLDAARTSGLPLAWFIAGLTTTHDAPGGAVEAVGMLGVMPVRRARRDDAQTPAKRATVFLEWHDNRWWMWRAGLDPSGRRVLRDTVVVRSAVDGDPLPGGLGRWWSASRRHRVRGSIGKAAAPEVH